MCSFSFYNRLSERDSIAQLIMVRICSSFLFKFHINTGPYIDLVGKGEVLSVEEIVQDFI